MQPGLCNSELSPDGMDRKARTFRDLLGRHSSKKTHFNQVGLEIICGRQPVKRLIERDDVYRPFPRKPHGLQKLATGVAAAFLGLTAAGMVHQYLSHDACGNAIEVRAVNVVWVGLSDHAEISFMN